MKIFDLCYVGCGPATMFSILHLIKNGYKGTICAIEKGKSLRDRLPNEVCNGSFGCGTYSDSKLSKSLNVGGIIPDQTQEELDQYGDLLLSYINEYLPEDSSPLKWDKNIPYNTAPSNLNWESNECCHIGSDVGRETYLKIEEYLSSQKNVAFCWETEVTDIVELTGDKYQILTSPIPKDPVLLANKVVVATGQRGSLPSKMVDQFNLTKENRMLQLGIRVEDYMNPQYEKIIEANYDFKFNKVYKYPQGIEVKVRTFCCNSGNAHVCAERPSEGYVAFNGHSYKKPDPDNHTVNYGIMCAVKNLPGLESKEDQIELMKEVNQLSTWENDNFNFYPMIKEPTSDRMLLDGLEHLRDIYPDVVIDSIHEFVYQLNKVVNLENAHYFYPEIKPSGTSPKVNYENMETEQKDLYMIGDCHNTNSIIKSAIEGFIFANHILLLEETKNKLKEVENQDDFTD